MGTVVVGGVEPPAAAEVLCVAAGCARGARLFDAPAWQWEPPVLAANVNLQRVKPYEPETWRCSLWQVCCRHRLPGAAHERRMAFTSLPGASSISYVVSWVQMPTQCCIPACFLLCHAENLQELAAHLDLITLCIMSSQGRLMWGQPKCLVAHRLNQTSQQLMRCRSTTRPTPSLHTGPLSGLLQAWPKK